jgi:hypothetical protein
MRISITITKFLEDFRMSRAEFVGKITLVLWICAGLLIWGSPETTLVQWVLAGITMLVWATLIMAAYWQEIRRIPDAVGDWYDSHKPSSILAAIACAIVFLLGLIGLVSYPSDAEGRVACGMMVIFGGIFAVAFAVDAGLKMPNWLCRQYTYWRSRPWVATGLACLATSIVSFFSAWFGANKTVALTLAGLAILAAFVIFTTLGIRCLQREIDRAGAPPSRL